jgi:AraC-like DNA-binding protein
MLRTSGEQSSEPVMQASQQRAYNAESVSRRDGDTDINAAPGGRIQGGLPPRIVRRISEYIDDNIDQRITLEALAKLANLSVSYFVRAFKQSMGLTPHDYLMRRRVQLTMQLLSQTDMPLSEIAHAAGFADQSHCARRFRRCVGMSPRDFRWLTP